MLRLHRAVPRFVPAWPVQAGLTARDLEEHITDRTKLLILGDCINPTGKVYTSDELRLLARVVAVHNVRREAEAKSTIQVLFDCPYEAHVLGPRAVTFRAIEVDVPGYGVYPLRRCTSTLTGPGKTYGMHGDRIGYAWAEARVATISGSFFGQGIDKLRHFVRLNCGRSIELLNEACTRIEDAVSPLGARA